MADMKRCEIPPSLDATNSLFLKQSVDVDNDQILLGSKLTPTAQVSPTNVGAKNERYCGIVVRRFIGDAQPWKAVWQYIVRTESGLSGLGGTPGPALKISDDFIRP